MSSLDGECWQLLEAFPDQNDVVATDGTVIFANSGFKQAVGYDSDDVAGATLPTLMYEADRDDV